MIKVYKMNEEAKVKAHKEAKLLFWYDLNRIVVFTDADADAQKIAAQVVDTVLATLPI